MRFRRVWAFTAAWIWPRRSSSAALGALGERVEVDHGLAHVRASSRRRSPSSRPETLVDVGDAHELVGDHLAQDLIDPRGARVGVMRTGGVGHDLGRARNLALFERLDDVARLEVLVVRQSDAALEAGGHFARVVLEAAKRRDRCPSR